MGFGKFGVGGCCCNGCDEAWEDPDLDWLPDAISEDFAAQLGSNWEENTGTNASRYDGAWVGGTSEEDTRDLRTIQIEWHSEEDDYGIDVSADVWINSIIGQQFGWADATIELPSFGLRVQLNSRFQGGTVTTSSTFSQQQESTTFDVANSITAAWNRVEFKIRQVGPAIVWDENTPLATAPYKATLYLNSELLHEIDEFTITLVRCGYQIEFLCGAGGASTAKWDLNPHQGAAFDKIEIARFPA